MVSKASDDFPDPLTPVMMISLPAGSVTSMFFRLCVRAPRTTNGLRAGRSLSGVATVMNFLESLRGEWYRPGAPGSRVHPRLEATQCHGIPPGGDRERDAQSGDGDHSAQIEQRHTAKPWNRDVRIGPEGGGSDGEQDPQFGRTTPAEREPEDAVHAGREENLTRNQQVRDQEGKRDDGTHKPGTGEPCHQSGDSDNVDDMVQVEAVAGTFESPDAGDGSIEAVAEPVERQCANRYPQPAWVVVGKAVSQTGQAHRRKGQ